MHVSGLFSTSSPLGRLLKKYRRPVMLLAAVSFIGAILEASFLVVVTGLAMGLVGDQPTVGPVFGRSLGVGTGLGVAAVVLVVRVALNLWGVRIAARVAADVTADQRLVLSHAYLGTTWAIQQGEPVGKLQELLTMFVTRVTWSMTVMTQAITASLSLFAFLGVGLAVDAVSALAVMGALGLVGTVLVPLRRRIRTRSQELSQLNLSFANSVSELGALGLEMQTFGVRERFADRIDRITRESTESQRQVQTLTGILSPIYIALAYAALLGAVAILTIVGFGDLTVIGAVMLLMLRSLNFGQQLASAWGSLAAHVPFLDRLQETVQIYRGAAASGGTVAPEAVTPLEFRDVSFAYSPSRSVLAGLNFRIDLGDVIGVIGPSGAGKSTLAQLLLGLRDPVQGSVRVCGRDLRDVDRDWWSDRVAFVPQDARLITGTVAENLRFFRPYIDDASLRRAARQANILAEIEALPEGFDTHLGERGERLSGGQRQRMSIARALAASPEMVVLDEPTSALDGLSEELIRETLASMKGETTIVIIAHRLSTLDVCDRIMVMENGGISAFDTPSAVQQSNAFYQAALAIAGMDRDD